MLVFGLGRYRKLWHREGIDLSEARTREFEALAPPPTSRKALE